MKRSKRDSIHVQPCDLSSRIEVVVVGITRGVQKILNPDDIVQSSLPSAFTF